MSHNLEKSTITVYIQVDHIVGGVFCARSYVSFGGVTLLGSEVNPKLNIGPHRPMATGVFFKPTK